MLLTKSNITSKDLTLALDGKYMKINISAILLSILCIGQNCNAAEIFAPRYNLAGSLGNELFAPPATAGFKGAITYTQADLDRVTGGDGNPLQSVIPGGTVPVPGLPSALQPTYVATPVAISATGTLLTTNIGIAYYTNDSYSGGRIGIGINIPFLKLKSTLKGLATTPTLNWPNPAVPNSLTKAAVASQFDASYQSLITSTGNASSGEVEGFGELELTGAWVKTLPDIRFQAGATLVLPTGKYNTGPSPVIGFGNFYTLRPSVQLNYSLNDFVALAGKVSLGINSPNADNQLRSGNWIGFEGSAGYLTPIGAFAVQWVRIHQYEDDERNTYGPSRFMTNNLGILFATKTPFNNTAVTMSVMKTFDSQNAQSGKFTQIRLVKQF